jgi:hypothetical protein
MRESEIIMKHYVLCLVDTDEAAQGITQKVAGAGFAKEEIYVLTSARENAHDLRGHREVGAGKRGSLSEGVGLFAGIGPGSLVAPVISWVQVELRMLPIAEK